MNGVHDMGGMHGFGKVVPEADEPVFHDTWEGRVLAMNRVMGACGQWNIDIGRFSRESLPPAFYLSATYYQKWHEGLQNLLLERAMITPQELQTGRAITPPKPVKPALAPEDFGAVMARGSFERPSSSPAKFQPGDRVRTLNIHPAGHTRLPRYARGHVGIVEAIRGCHVFPDAVCEGRGEDPHWLYTVVFSGTELWGDQADPTLQVSIDAWEPYLEGF